MIYTLVISWLVLACPNGSITPVLEILQSTKSTNSLSETLESDFIFVSVPTPSNADGSISLDIVYDCFNEMDMLNKMRLDDELNKFEEKNL